VKYEILGPLRVVDDDGPSLISAPNIEILLAALLARAGQLVPAHELFSEIWGDEAPRRATAGLHVYVSKLRKFLSRRGLSRSPIVTRPPGYLLQLGGDEFDADEFLRHARAGREHIQRERFEEAVRSFERGLGLWRDSVLSDLPKGPIVEGFAALLAEERLACTEQAIDAALAMGRHRELIGRLYLLTADHPLREAFYRQLMLALYRSERRADALLVYKTARQNLDRALGVEPGRSLQSLHRAILVSDRRLHRLTAWAVPGDGGRGAA
jgi:DNA-binding SARP family transcriptional activator